jgi:hypothetical protein
MFVDRILDVLTVDFSNFPFHGHQIHCTLDSDQFLDWLKLSGREATAAPRVA